MLWSKIFDETSEKTQWRKIQQVQPMQLCIFSGRQFEEAFENTLCAPSEDSFDDTKWRKSYLGKFITNHDNLKHQWNVINQWWCSTQMRNLNFCLYWLRFLEVGDPHYYGGDGVWIHVQQWLVEINVIQMLRCNKKAPHLAWVTLKKRWVTTSFKNKSSNIKW